MCECFVNVCDSIVWMQDVAKRPWGRGGGVLWHSQIAALNQIENVCKTSTLDPPNIMNNEYVSAAALGCIVHLFVTSRLDSNI